MTPTAHACVRRAGRGIEGVQPGYSPTTVPDRGAWLGYLYAHDRRLLRLDRAKAPNAGLHSPIGGKVEISLGESPHECARREAIEESGVVLADRDLRLTGIVNERAYQGEKHWLIFLFEATRPIRPDEVCLLYPSDAADE